MIRKVARIHLGERLLVNSIINRFIKRGHKDFVGREIYQALHDIKKNRKRSITKLVNDFYINLRPAVQLKPRFASGLVYMLPAPIPLKKEYTMALTWFYKGVGQRLDLGLGKRIFNEFNDVLGKRGRAIGLKLDYYKQIVSNRVLLYRFKKKAKR